MARFPAGYLAEPLTSPAPSRFSGAIRVGPGCPGREWRESAAVHFRREFRPRHDLPRSVLLAWSCRERIEDVVDAHLLDEFLESQCRLSTNVS